MAYRQLDDQFRDRPFGSPFPEPEQPVGRVKEIEAIRSVLALITSESTPVHLWLWGPQGTGKTLCATFVAAEIAKSHRALVALSNCWNSNSLYGLVNDIIDQFGIMRAELQDTRFKLDRMKKHIRDKQCVFIIDEIDRLEAKERNAVLYQFQDLNNFWIIAISHQEPQKLGIEPRVWSRLSPIAVGFDPYNVDQIRDLLRHKLQRTESDSKPKPALLREIAEQSNGDARRAEKLLLQRAILGLTGIGKSQGTGDKGNYETPESS